MNDSGIVSAVLGHFGCANLVLCTVCFAGYCITTKCLYNEGINPYQLNFIVNFLTMILLCFWLRISPPPTYRSFELPYYLCQSLFMGLMATLWPFAVYFSDPANVSIFIGLGPLMTAIINWKFGLDQLNIVQYAITATLAISGMALALQPKFIFGNEPPDYMPFQKYGYCIMSLAVFCYACFACCQRYRKTDEVLTLFLRTCLTTCIFGICSIFVSWKSLTFFQWTQIFLLILLNLIALLCLTIGCQETAPTTSALIFLLEIPFTYIGTAIIFGEVLNISQYAGVVLILLAIGQYLVKTETTSDLTVSHFGSCQTPGHSPETTPLLHSGGGNAACYAA